VGAGDNALAAAQPPTETAIADALFGLTNLWTFHLRIEPEAWKAMEPEPLQGPRRGGPAGFPRDYTFVRARLEFEGRPVGDIGVRYKGNSSFMAARDSLKRSFKLDFNRFVKGQKFYGLTELNLNNNAMDPSQMREALAYAIFRRAAVPAPRTAYARLYLTVPGQREREFVGLYTVVEQVDERFLRERFGTKKGLLLKPERAGGLAYLGEDWAPYEQRYEPKTDVSAEAARRLIDFTRLVTEGSDAAWREQIGTFLEIGPCLTFFALQAALANLDSPLYTGHNYYLYLQSQTGRFHFIPWDLNEAFGGFFPAGSAEEQTNLSIRRPFPEGQRFLERLWAMPEHKESFRERYAALLATALKQEQIFADIDAIARVIRPAVAEDESFPAALFEQNLTETPTEVSPEGRAGEPRPERAPGGPPRRGGLGGPRMPKPPLKQFVARRLESIRAQLDGQVEGSVPRRMRGGPGGGPFEGGPGARLAEQVLRAADGDGDGKLTRPEFVGLFARWFTQWDIEKSGALDEAHLDAGLREALPPPPFDGPPGPPPDARTPEDPPDPPRARPGAGRSRREDAVPRRPGSPGPVLARRMLEAGDTSDDRKLSREELERAAEKWFAAWDADQSGALDIRKLVAGLSKLLGPPPQP
jgi:hypothetical protein